MNDPVIQVRRLSRTFGSFRAVDDVSFDVGRGEIFGFLGANGAGKSTTIRMLCGLLRPSGGTALVGGYDVAREPERVKARIGYMSQKFSLYDDLTVIENVRFFGGVYGLSRAEMRERAAWAVEMAGLGGREESLTRTLPTGWKQRLALGCALLHRPPIVFLDEPTGGVDPVSRRSFWELINDLSEQGSTVFVTTHYLDEAEYCNRIMLMQAGRIVAGGSPLELKRDHVPYPVLEVACAPVVEALELLRGEPWAAEVSIFGASLHVMVRDAPEGAAARVRAALSARGVEVARIDPITPSLEDVFLHVMANAESGARGAV